MNAKKTGVYLATKRREKNWTQQQLAEKLGVSSKTISKWERGLCLPDYSMIEALCQQLSITVSELLAGQDEKEARHVELENLLERVSQLEKQRSLLSLVVMVLMGKIMMPLSHGIAGQCGSGFYERRIAGHGSRHLCRRDLSGCLSDRQ